MIRENQQNSNIMIVLVSISSKKWIVRLVISTIWIMRRIMSSRSIIMGLVSNSRRWWLLEISMSRV